MRIHKDGVNNMFVFLYKSEYKTEQEAIEKAKEQVKNLSFVFVGYEYKFKEAVPETDGLRVVFEKILEGVPA